jgi:Ala-tRNA(Pro) deacylase
MNKERQDQVCAALDEIGVKYSKVDHPPLFTQADNEIHRVNIGAVIFKNLFLRNKDKSRYYLLSLPLTQRADLRLAAELIGETRLSFGSDGELFAKLNIRPGSVSFLNVIGAPDTDVTFLMDSSVNGYDLIGVHPNDNTATVIFAPREIPKIWERYGVEYKYLDLGGIGCSHSSTTV